MTRRGRGLVTRPGQRAGSGGGEATGFVRSRAGNLPAMPDTVSAPDLPVVLLSHRAPVTFGRDGDQRTADRGAGGLVSALVGLAAGLEDSVWVCAAGSDEDR